MLRRWLLLCVLPCVLSARNVGQVGSVFPISEKEISISIKAPFEIDLKGLFKPLNLPKLSSHQVRMVKKEVPFGYGSMFSYGGILLIFDGTDEEQLAWALSQESHALWVLAAGNPITLAEQMGRPVYFDQGGAICKGLSITCVPTKASISHGMVQLDEGLW